MILQKINSNSIDQLVDISRLTFHETFFLDNTNDDMQSYMDTQLTKEKLLSQLSCQDSMFYLAYVEEQQHRELAGYLKLNFWKAQSELRDPNALEIERIYVRKKFKGLGIGQNMLQKSIDIALKAKKKYIFLGVWEHNKSAISFYQKNGFVQFDTHTFWLGNSQQTDWLMKLELNECVN